MSLSLRPRDPLLAIGRFVVRITQAFIGLGVIALLIGLPVAILFKERIAAKMVAQGNPDFVFPTLAIVGVLILGGAILAMAFLFLEHLRKMIDTVGQGDPFVPENAERLTAMAWLALTIQLLVIPIGGLVLLAARQFKPENFHFEAGLDLGGIILVITLFILARVFRKGTEMREELEGTV